MTLHWCQPFSLELSAGAASLTADRKTTGGLERAALVLQYPLCPSGGDGREVNDSSAIWRICTPPYRTPSPTGWSTQSFWGRDIAGRYFLLPEDCTTSTSPIRPQDPEYISLRFNSCNCVIANAMSWLVYIIYILFHIFSSSLNCMFTNVFLLLMFLLTLSL